MIEFKSKDFIPSDSEIAINFNQRTVHFKEHKHDFIEFVYILSGTCNQYINGTRHQVQKGDLIYIAQNETHAFESDAEVLSYEIYVRPSFIHTLLSEQPNDILALSLFKDFSSEISSISPKVSFQGACLLEIETLLRFMHREHALKASGKSHVLKGYFLVLLTKFLREIRKSQMIHLEKQIQRIMPEIIQYIEQNYYRSLSLEQLAEKSFYNPSYFSRIFKELYKKNLTEYITEKRILEAVKLLENTSYTIEAICRMVGYSDKKHFYKMFKSKMGLTPGQYRRETVQHNNGGTE